MKFAIILTFFFLMSSCSIPGLTGPEVKSIKEIRKMQTEYLNGQDSKMVMKATLNTLQDDDFMITYTDLDVGIVTAEKSENAESIMDVVITNYLNALFAGLWSRTPKGMKTIHVNVNISEIGKKIKVRTTFIVKMYDKQGNLIKQNSITKPEVFNAFYKRLEASFVNQQ